MTENQITKNRRRVKGEGSVYKRGDGYWVGALDVPNTSGARKRIVVYGKTWPRHVRTSARSSRMCAPGFPSLTRCGS